MKFALCIAIILVTVSRSQAQHAQSTSHSGDSQMPVPAHVTNTFHFQVNAPLSQAAPLFGPEGERSWAGEHWNPEFLYPHPSSNAASSAEDVQGAVFTIRHGALASVWVNTIFDLSAGRMQYVAVIPDRMVSVVDVRLRSATAATTAVEVTYTRTALDPSLNEEVIAHGNQDRESGAEWEKAIEAGLKQAKKTP